MAATTQRGQVWRSLAVIGAVECLGPGLILVESASAADTKLEDVVLYAVDSGDDGLFRYTFKDNTLIRIGTVVDENGNVVEDLEALTFIPNGPYAGFYAGSNYYETKPSRIIRINPLDATAVTLPSNVGFEKVEGLLAVRDPVTGAWRLMGSTQRSGRALIWIDPATGAGSLIKLCANNYDGLAMTPAGVLYGVTRTSPSRLYSIDYTTMGPDTLIGNLTGYSDAESLEWVYGDTAAKIDCTGIVPDPSWTAGGILFSFVEPQDALLILNPATGAAVKYPCAMQGTDVEGLVFTTLNRDPYGKILVDPHD